MYPLIQWEGAYIHVTHTHTHTHVYSRSHLGWKFRMLFQSSKLNARTSLFTETWQKRRLSFELWAFENVTTSGIGCIYASSHCMRQRESVCVWWDRESVCACGTRTCIYASSHTHAHWLALHLQMYNKLRITSIIVSTENTTSPKSTPKSRNSDFSLFRGTHSNWDFCLIWICTEEFEILDLVDFGGVAFSVKSVIVTKAARMYMYINIHTYTHTHSLSQHMQVRSTTDNLSQPMQHACIYKSPHAHTLSLSLSPHL